MLVLVEKTENGYRASSGKPLEAETFGTSRTEALDRLRAMITQRLQGEVEVIDMEIPSEQPAISHPFLRLFGAFRDDPTFEEWQKIIAESRRIENEASGIFPEHNP